MPPSHDDAVRAYTKKITAFKRDGKWKAALYVFEEMKQNRVWPNVVSYSAAISACEKGGQTAKALELLAEMKELREALSEGGKGNGTGGGGEAVFGPASVRWPISRWFWHLHIPTR